MNKTSLGRTFTAIGVSAALAAGSLFAVTAPANAATAKPIYLSFEANDANAATVAAGAFEGASAALDNVPAGGNASGKGVKFTKTGNPWSGLNVFVNRPERWTDSANKTITFDYYSPDSVASPVMIKLQDPGAAFKAVLAQPGWNSLSFDMSTGAGWSDAIEYKTLAIFPNFGSDNGIVSTVPNTGQVYYIDNISVNGGTIANVETNGPAPRVAASLLLTFEANDTVGALATGTNADADGAGSFEGAGANEIADAPAGGNGGKALKFTKTGNPWSGFTLVKDSAGTNKFGSTAFPIITTNFFNSSASAVPVMLKLEAGPSNARKYQMAAPGWSKLTFDMSSGASNWDGSKEYDTVVFFPNFADGDLNAPAAQPNTGQLYWFDDVAFNGATTPGLGSGRSASSLLLTFEANDTVGALATGANSDADGAGSFEGAGPNEIADAPAGGNGGKALKFTKTGNPWSGFVLVNDANGTNKFASTAFPVITTNFYNSSEAAVPVMLKLEAGPSNARKYVMAAPGWSKLTFDMSSGASNWDGTKEYNTVVLFPNFADGDLNAPAAQPNTGQLYWFDDVAFNGATTPAIVVPRVAASLLLTFEDNDAVGALATGTNDVDGAGSFEGAGPNEIADAPAGGNGGKALKFTKTGNPWSGFTVIKDTNGTNKFGSTAFPVITTNFYNSSAAAVPVMLKLENGPSNARKYVMAAPGWSTLTFDMSSGASGWDGTKEYTDVVFFPNFADGDLGAPAAQANEGQLYWFDNIAFNGATTPAIPEQPVVKVAQTIGVTIKTVMAGKLAALPAKTNKSLVVKWVSRTKTICVIAGTPAAPKVKALKAGTCKLTGTNAGNSTKKPVTTYRSILVKK